MIEIDGNQGEGGGQILRTSLALSMITGTAVRINNIRAGRAKPGLMRQHLTAVKAAQTICSAELEGAALKSTTLTFRPASIKAGTYHFAVGTAGSTNLVFQTVLPALLHADAPSHLTLEGGTHNPHAPPYDFIAESFIPLMKHMGVKITTQLQQYGFYPAGGGRWTATIQPTAQLQPLRLTERGELLEHEAVAVWLNLPGHIGERELATVADQLNWPRAWTHLRELPKQPGKGNYLRIKIVSEQVCEIFSGFGEYGVKAEKIATDCAHQVKRYLSSDAPVGEHLADQLLLPIALAGQGEFVTLKPSLHTQTNIAVIEKFLPVRFKVEEKQRDLWLVSV